MGTVLDWVPDRSLRWIYKEVNLPHHNGRHQEEDAVSQG